jgi:hypothetical protein
MGIRKLWALGALALALLAGCGSASKPATAHKPARPATFTLAGQVQVSHKCSAMASDGYSDITPGAQVTITGPTGKVVAVGPLGTPFWDGVVCTFPFRIDRVPVRLAQYGITVSHRGTLDYTWAQVQQPVIMTLGAG